jgi:hypothetical protein
LGVCSRPGDLGSATTEAGPGAGRTLS